MASSDRSGLRVTASDALEFEPVKPEPRKRSWGARVVASILVVVGAAAAWEFYGPGLVSQWGGADAGVPLIKAEVGPIKVRPENPGGLKVPDRDKLVYDRIEGSAEGRGPERLLPPPETPLPKPGEAEAMARAKADQAAAQAAARKAPTPKTNPVASVPTVKDVVRAQRPAPPPPPPAPSASAKSTSPMLAASTSGDEAKPKAPTNIEEKAPPPKPAAKSAPKPSVPATQPPPPAMPKAPVTTATATPAPMSAPASAPKPIPVGEAYLVQLAAARSPKGAEDEWKRLQGKHRDLLDGLRLRVMKADLGQRGIFYRLRAGPLADATAAKALCQELAKREVGCLVIMPGG